MELGKLTRCVGMGLVVMFLLGIFLGTAFVMYQRWQAGRMLALIQKIRIGVTTEAEFVKSTKGFFPFAAPPGDWNRQGPTTEFDSEYRAPWELVQFGVRFERGLAVERDGLFFTQGRGHPDAGAVVRERLSGDADVIGLQSKNISHHEAFARRAGKPGTAFSRISIEDDELAPDADKKADWDFNLNCMTRIGGCHDSREILPEVRLTSLSQIPGQ
jgi:hypothetical protein